MSADTRQALADLLRSNDFGPMSCQAGAISKCMCLDCCIKRARAALAAQPVAGAVAPMFWYRPCSNGLYEGPLHDAQIEDVRKRSGAWVPLVPQAQAAPAPEPSRSQKMREAGFTARDTRLTCDECGAKFTRQFAPLHECAAPEPSAQAVAHPSHQTVREWMPVSEALRLSDLWTAGDLDNCGQWRAAIKVLADEVRALAASPQPEPSAHGEQVATVTEEMVTAYLTANDAYWKHIDGEPTKLGKWRNGTPSEATRVSLMAALASAPSTPPHAVVEDVPLNFDQLQKVMSKHFGGRELTDDEADSAEAFARAIERAHGIAPKAAQEKT